MKKIAFLLLIVLILSYYNLSFASSRGLAIEQNLDKQETPSKSKFHASVGHNASHMHYKEFNGQDTLDESYGKLTGFYLEAGYRSNNYWELLNSKPFIEAYFRRFDDTISYDGATGSGPIMFDEKNEIQRFGIKLGGYRELSSEKGDFFYYLDLGKRAWYRGENGTIGAVILYAEKYYWTYFGLGSGFNYSFTPRITAGLDIDWMFAISPKMRADLYEGGTFNLENVWGFEVKAPIKYFFGENLSFDITPYFTYWNIDQSDPVTISGASYIEPDSKTHIEGVLVGLSYNF